MKKIKSYQDISEIIKLKSDIKDDLGSTISFIAFLRMKLIDIDLIIENGEYTY